MPEKPMTPSRLHSARRNKKWRVMTASGALLLLLCGAFSVSHETALIVRASNVRFITGTYAGNLAFAVKKLPPGIPGKRLDLAFDHEHQPGSHDLLPLPNILFVSSGLAILIPFWLLTLIFVLTQYLLLPKSLPVTEEK